jgi:hypothetical protein
MSYFYETEGRSLQRVSIEYKRPKTIKTNDVANVVPNGFSISDWYDCEGFDKVAVTSEITGVGSSTKLQVDVEFSHDGVNKFGGGQAIGTGSFGAVGNEKQLLAKYFRVVVKNTDTALAGAVKAYAYLKI